jgi:hypothetical protein
MTIPRNIGMDGFKSCGRTAMAESMNRDRVLAAIASASEVLVSVDCWGARTCSVPITKEAAREMIADCMVSADARVLVDVTHDGAKVWLERAPNYVCARCARVGELLELLQGEG